MTLFFKKLRFLYVLKGNLMKKILLISTLLASTCSFAFEGGNQSTQGNDRSMQKEQFEKQMLEKGKAKELEYIKEEIQLLNTKSNCISSAQNRENFHNCHKQFHQGMQNLMEKKKQEKMQHHQEMQQKQMEHQQQMQQEMQQKQAQRKQEFDKGMPKR